MKGTIVRLVSTEMLTKKKVEQRIYEVAIIDPSSFCAQVVEAVHFADAPEMTTGTEVILTPPTTACMGRPMPWFVDPLVPTRG